MMTYSQKNLLLVLGGFALIFIAIDQTADAFGATDPIAGYWLAALVAIISTLVIEIFVFKRKWADALRFLGFGRPQTRTMLVTAITGGITMLFFPVFSYLTGASVSLPQNWLWKLSGIVALHGIGEEVLFRGFLFHHLRSERTFHRAAFLSLIVFAIAHVYLFTYMPAPIALFATVLSLASAYPFAYLFEQGNNTVWAPALFHTMVHAVSFFVISEPQAMTAGIAWMTIWIVSALLVFAFRKRLFEASPTA